MKCSILIAAAGSGSRMKAGKNKLFLELDGEPILRRTVRVFEQCAEAEEIVVIAAPTETEQVRAMLADCRKPLVITAGGETRQQSVLRGLRAAHGEVVLVHDGARPLVTAEEVAAVYEGVLAYGCAALGMAVKDTVKRVDRDGFIIETPPRETLYAAATPQGFYRAELLRWHETAQEAVTDDCMLAEANGRRVKMIPCGYRNLKLTTAEDLLFAELYLKGSEEKA